MTRPTLPLHPLVAGLLLAALHGLAQAQAAPVSESVDPQRAAAVQRTAEEIKAKIARDLAEGRKPEAVGIVRGKTEGGLAFLSGGITTDDRVAMHGERAAYSLWVATVARPSGAYLADARLRIVNLKSRQPVVERTMEGPWFLVALPAGRYEVTATLQADEGTAPQTLSTQVNVAAKGQRQAVLRFASKAEVSPDMQSVFGGNPFGAPTPRKDKP